MWNLLAHLKRSPRRTLPPIIISESKSSGVSLARRNLVRGYLLSGWTNTDLLVSPSFPAAGKAEGKRVAGVLADAPPHGKWLQGTMLSVLLAPPMTQWAVVQYGSAPCPRAPSSSSPCPAYYWPWIVTHKEEGLHIPIQLSITIVSSVVLNPTNRCRDYFSVSFSGYSLRRWNNFIGIKDTFQFNVLEIVTWVWVLCSSPELRTNWDYTYK